MAIAKACYVICDKCGDPAEVSTEGDTLARTYARQQGYTFKGGKDLCPRCNGEGVPIQRQAENDLENQGRGYKAD